MRPLLRVAALLGAAVSTAAVAGAGAREKIYIEADIPYASDTVGSPALRAECDWTTRLAKGIARESLGRVAIAPQGLAQQPGATLVITIVQADIRPGGAYSGTKTARLHGELRRDGVVIDRFILTRGNEMALTACGAAKQLARNLAVDVAAWVKEHPLPPAPTSPPSENKP
jgi:hypothetical protein